jgi:hypothetical protein
MNSNLSKHFLIIIVLQIILLRSVYSKSFDNDDFSKVISFLNIKIIHDNKLIDQNSSHNCTLKFYDDLNNIVNQTISSQNNYIIIKSYPGKVFLKEISCYRKNFPFFFGAYRTKYINDQGFVAHNGFINYAGDLTIKFNSSYLLLSDIFNLSAFSIDYDSVIGYKISENIINAINFVKSNIPNYSNFKIAKSLFGDNHFLKPNDDPEIIDSNELHNSNYQKPINIQSNQVLKSPNQENIYSNIYQKTDISKQENISPNVNSINNLPTNNESFQKNDMPSHSYLAPYYSEFYAPNINQYYSIKGDIYDSNNIYLDIQDPVQEKPWFEPKLKQNY